MESGVSLTLNEAGYVVEQSNIAINRAVDRGLIKAKLHRRGKTNLRKVWPAELRFLAISGEVERKLTPAGRREVYEAMRRLSTDAHRLDIGVMTFQLLDVDRRIAERLKRLQEIKTMVGETPNGEPLLRGFNLPVYEISALSRGLARHKVNIRAPADHHSHSAPRPSREGRPSTRPGALRMAPLLISGALITGWRRGDR